MLRKIAILIGLAAALPQHVAAHLSETLPQVNVQYGRPLYKYAGQQPGEVIWKYKWRDYFVYVTYFGGKSEDETYLHQNTKARFGRDEVQSLLGIESLGMHWKKASAVPMWSLIAHDGKTTVAIAGYWSTLPGLDYPGFSVSTIAYVKRHKIPGI